MTCMENVTYRGWRVNVSELHAFNEWRNLSPALCELLCKVFRGSLRGLLALIFGELRVGNFAAASLSECPESKQWRVESSVCRACIALHPTSP